MPSQGSVTRRTLICTRSVTAASGESSVRAGDQLFGDVVNAGPELRQRVAFDRSRHWRHGGQRHGTERQRADQDCGCTRRMRPSCAVLATSTPSRE